MKKVIRDESELPAPAAFVTRMVMGEPQELANPIRLFAYLRCLTDPCIYIHPFTGELFVRSDGLMWKHGGYRIELDRDGQAERSSSTAFGDNKIFPYEKQKAAA